MLLISISPLSYNLGLPYLLHLLMSSQTCVTWPWSHFHGFVISSISQLPYNLASHIDDRRYMFIFMVYLVYFLEREKNVLQMICMNRWDIDLCLVLFIEKEYMSFSYKGLIASGIWQLNYVYIWFLLKFMLWTLQLYKGIICKTACCCCDMSFVGL